MGLLFRSLRPIQWTKNGFILIPLIFAQRLLDLQSLLLSLQAVTIFCLLSGSVYLINDLIDLRADQQHPTKRHRPLAAGLISRRMVTVTAAILLPISLLWGLACGKGFFLVLLAYVGLQGLYNAWLKEVVILDIFCISFGFFLRVMAGAVVIQALISHWLILCTVLISMFLALGKRRNELMVLGQDGASRHRKVLEGYSPYLLDQMIGVITAGILVTYMLYCISPETIQKFHTHHLIYTLPFVLYGIFRYLYLIHKEDQGGAPEKILFSDLPLALSVLLWTVSCAFIIYGGP